MTTIQVITLLGAILGLVVNTGALLGIAWKGGLVLGQMKQSQEGFSRNVTDLTSEVQALRESLEQQNSIQSRTVSQLDGLEKRVERIERNHDREPHS